MFWNTKEKKLLESLLTMSMLKTSQKILVSQRNA